MLPSPFTPASLPAASWLPTDPSPPPHPSPAVIAPAAVRKTTRNDIVDVRRIELSFLLEPSARTRPMTESINRTAYYEVTTCQSIEHPSLVTGGSAQRPRGTCDCQLRA